MHDHDFNLLKTPRRYIDALGKMEMLSDFEAVIVEASSGPLSEDVAHTIEDNLKTIECATASLSQQASQYKNASIETFKKLKIYSVQIIKKEMTLTSTTLNDEYTWKRIDLRTATMPTYWDDRPTLIQYFELLATLMIGLKETSDLLKKIKKEHLLGCERQTVGEFLDVANDQS